MLPYRHIFPGPSISSCLCQLASLAQKQLVANTWCAHSCSGPATPQTAMLGHTCSSWNMYLKKQVSLAHIFLSWQVYIKCFFKERVHLIFGQVKEKIKKLWIHHTFFLLRRFLYNLSMSGFSFKITGVYTCLLCIYIVHIKQISASSQAYRICVSPFLCLYDFIQQKSISERHAKNIDLSFCLEYQWITFL